jgi:hypothetical protein
MVDTDADDGSPGRWFQSPPKVAVILYVSPALEGEIDPPDMKVFD